MTNPDACRILIVDDETAHLLALCDTLGEQGYDPVGFSSGGAALEALRESRFELMLTDLMMPEMDGLTLLRAALQVDPQLAGVLMTGQGTIDSAVEAMKIGAFDYILKPFKLRTALPVLARARDIRRLRVENAQLEQDLRSRTAKLEAANAELNAFSYSVSHDLRSPLRSIRSQAGQLIQQFSTQLPDEARVLLARIETGAQKMSKLIEDLLRFSRVGRQSVLREPVQVSALVREVMEELQRELVPPLAEVVVTTLPDCIGDAALLKQVFVNLLSNAFKFTRNVPQARIEVGSLEQDGETIYFVRDNGVGFDMQRAGKLFGVFERLHSASEFEGTGLGLSIVQRILQRHGGRIWAQSQVGQGTTFSFSLGR